MEAFSVSKVDSTFNGAFTEKFLSSLGELVARQTVGLDFVFVKRGDEKFPICVELNGFRSGIDGMYKLEKTGDNPDVSNRILARAYSNDFPEWIIFKIISKKYFGRSGRSTSFWSLLRLRYLIQKRIINKRYVDLEALRREYFNNKLKQKYLIPTKHRVKPLRPASSDCSSPLFVLKPLEGAQGKGVKIMERSEVLSSDLLYSNSCVIEPLLDVLPADLAKEGLKGHKASMRVFANLRFYRKGGIFGGPVFIIPDFALAYQRVARGKSQSIVNYSTGAIAVRASQREFDLAWPVFGQIAENMAKKILGANVAYFLYSAKTAEAAMQELL